MASSRLSRLALNTCNRRPVACRILDNPSSLLNARCRNWRSRHLGRWGQAHVCNLASTTERALRSLRDKRLANSHMRPFITTTCFTTTWRGLSLHRPLLLLSKRSKTKRVRAAASP